MSHCMAEPEQIIYMHSPCTLYQQVCRDIQVRYACFLVHGTPLYMNLARLLRWISTPTKYLHCNRTFTSSPLSANAVSKKLDNRIPVTLSSNPHICPIATTAISIINARSIRIKSTDISNHINQHDLDFVATTEA